MEDAIIFLLHLDRLGSTVRVMFFDFSSALNTIEPALLGSKLTAMQVDAPLVFCIVNYLICRPQYVRLQGCMSDTVVSNTGAPQETVLSPFLFTLYTSDFTRRKMKELMVDISRGKTPTIPISIQGVDMENVKDYKYLGVHLDSKLD